MFNLCDVHSNYIIGMVRFNMFVRIDRIGKFDIGD